MRLPFLVLAALFPVTALAVDPNEAPAPTPTTISCQDGQVWDADKGACVAPEKSGLSDDALYEAAREFAFAGRYQHAIRALEAMQDQRSDRVLTYLGFTLRKSGEGPEGMAYYMAALEENPDNLLARAYMGQAYVDLGRLDKARDQLREIIARGGAGSWPERALAQAIFTGTAAQY